MFSFHIYIVEHHSPSEDETSTKRPTRGATRLRQLLIRRANGQKTPVDIDVDTRISRGSLCRRFQKLFRNVVTRENINPYSSF